MVTLLRVRISKKMVLCILLPYILITASLTYFLLPADVFELESKLAEAEISRNVALWLFDSFLWIFIVSLALTFAMFYFVIKRKRQILTIMFILLILPMMIISLTNSHQYIQSERKHPLAKVVVIITFDGTRADVFWNVADFFVETKSESVWAQRISCTYPTMTHPNHLSIFTGAWPQVHGDELNPGETRRFWLIRSHRPSRVEDIFSIAKKYGIITAMFTATALPNVINEYPDYVYYPINDENCANQFIKFLEENVIDIKRFGLLAFVHFEEPDHYLHEYGSSSQEYEIAIRTDAERVRRIVSKIYSLGLENDTVVIVTADHGGFGRGHGMVFPIFVSDVPLWMWGKCLRKGIKLGGLRLVDIAAIVSFILGIPKPNYCIGITPYRIFNETLLQTFRGIENPLEAEKNELQRALFQEYCEIIFYLTMIYLMIILLSILIVLLKKERAKIMRKRS